MRRDAIERLGMTLAQRLPYLLDLVGRGVQSTAHDQVDALGAQPFGFLAQRLGRRLAVDHGFHGRILIAPRDAHASLPCVSVRYVFGYQLSPNGRSSTLNDQALRSWRSEEHTSELQSRGLLSYAA